ncbi:MAG: hypothetical protein P8Y24_01880 [Gammaproteobacteria bacterium]|jgi:hypothetical protein
MDKQSYMERINTFIQKGNYHAAINVALSAMNACRKQQDQAGIDEFIDVIRGIVQTLAKEFASDDYLATFKN